MGSAKTENYMLHNTQYKFLKQYIFPFFVHFQWWKIDSESRFTEKLYIVTIFPQDFYNHVKQDL